MLDAVAPGEDFRSMEFKRLFTQREAESALPLVRQIVVDVLETAARIREMKEDDDELPGLFPSIIDGETVFLCWRSDESQLAWYHPIEDTNIRYRIVAPFLLSNRRTAADKIDNPEQSSAECRLLDLSGEQAVDGKS
jgi:hypothetical protein